MIDMLVLRCPILQYYKHTNTVGAIASQQAGWQKAGAAKSRPLCRPLFISVTVTLIDFRYCNGNSFW